MEKLTLALCAGQDRRSRFPSAFAQRTKLSVSLAELFARQSYLLLQRLLRGLPCDPLSLRHLAELAERLAEIEES